VKLWVPSGSDGSSPHLGAYRHYQRKQYDTVILTWKQRCR